MAKKGKKLNSYMGPLTKWLSRWRLRRIIIALEAQIQQGVTPEVQAVAVALEATEIMSRGTKKDANVTIRIERAQLDAFIRYMCSLHDAKISRIMLARIGLATLMMRDEKALRRPAAEVIEDEIKRSGENKSTILRAADNQLELDL